MKSLLLFLFMSTTTLVLADDGMYKGFTKSEKRFIKNVETVQQEYIISITREDPGYVMLVFPTAKYLLNINTGFVANLWILGDDDITWEEMGPEY